jgi:hypothetical protein
VTAVKVELWRGPLDGDLHEIPDGTKLWIVSTPTSMRDVMRMSEADIPMATTIQSTEHCYAITERFGTTSGARIFEYVGERVKK